MRIPFRETLIAGICVAILCGLGTWQLQRLHWKNRIIAELEQSYTQGKNRNLTDGLLQSVNDHIQDFAYGTVQGHLLKDKAILLGPRVQDGRSGYNLLVPLELEDGVLIVDTGWVSDLWNDTLEERLATLPLDVSVRGLVRYPDYSSLASKNSPENDLWFRADPKEIAAAKGIGNAYNVLLFADNINPPLQDVLPHEGKFLPRNKHMQYALFWYAMAAVMLGVYGFYVYGLNRKQAAERN